MINCIYQSAAVILYAVNSSTGGKKSVWLLKSCRLMPLDLKIIEQQLKGEKITLR